MESLNSLISKVGLKKIQGSSLEPGRLYHDIPFFSTVLTHRSNTQLRVNKILEKCDVKGKRGLDLGCAVGGITFRLQEAGANMTGIDYDEANINLANGMDNYFGAGVKFSCAIITNESISELGQYEFIIWFDQWMWLLKQIGFQAACESISIISQKTDCLFFSTTQGDAMASSNEIKTSKDVFNILKINTDYKIEDLGTVNDGWFPRNIFRCYR